MKEKIIKIKPKEKTKKRRPLPTNSFKRLHTSASYVASSSSPVGGGLSIFFFSSTGKQTQENKRCPLPTARRKGQRNKHGADIQFGDDPGSSILGSFVFHSGISGLGPSLSTCKWRAVGRGQSANSGYLDRRLVPRVLSVYKSVLGSQEYGKYKCSGTSMASVKPPQPTEPCAPIDILERDCVWG